MCDDSDRPMLEKVKDYIEETCPDETVLLMDGYESAIAGVIEIGGKTHVVYDEHKCIDALMSQGMDYEEATDYFSYNTLRAIPYMDKQGNIPIIINNLADY